MEASLRGRRLKQKRKEVLGERETRGPGRARREGKACQETIVFLVFNIHQANVKIFLRQTLHASCDVKHVSFSKDVIDLCWIL